MTPRNRRLIGVRLLAPVAALAALLVGCSGPSGGTNLADVYENSSGEGYVSGDGRIVQPPTAEREAAIPFGGVLDTGDTFDSASLDGRVTIINFWYAACPPCREEAPDLASLRTHFHEADVAMLGVNVSDTADVALGFAAKFGVGYPSIVDHEDNGVQLAFAASELAPNSVPTTLVLDKQGRVAARISGLIQDVGIVTDIVDELLAEQD